MGNRLIEVKDLPKSLWCDESKVLKLPSILAAQWESLLTKHGLLGLAKEEPNKGFIGGPTQDDCDEHLAWRYNGSCGRVVLSLLDPNQKLNEVSNAYASVFAGGRVLLADLPCGSGAATMSILTTIAELRSENVLPRIPLNVVVVGADISRPACRYFDEQIASIATQLKEQAIVIEHISILWDALDRISTADLIRELTLRNQLCNSRLLVVSNFSGFLDFENNFQNVKPQIDDLFIHSRATTSIAIWIEPQTKKAKRVWSLVTNWFTHLFKYYKKHEHQENAKVYAEDCSNLQHPIKDGNFPVHLSVRRFELPL